LAGRVNIGIKKSFEKTTQVLRPTVLRDDKSHSKGRDGGNDHLGGALGPKDGRREVGCRGGRLGGGCGVILCDSQTRRLQEKAV